MALRQIRFYNDELLRKKSKPVKKINENIITLLDDMMETLKWKNGLGLAAPQVGVLKRIVIIQLDEEVYEMINPEVVETSGTQLHNEACLSIPGKSGVVERPEYVKVKATDRNGEEYEVEGREMLAVAMMHELDHLDGVLYIDKAQDISDIDEDDVEEAVPDDDESGEDN